MDKPKTRRSAPLTDKESISQEEQDQENAAKPIILENIFNPEEHEADESVSSIEPVDDEEDCDSDGNDIINFAADNNNRFAMILERMDNLEKENEILKARNNEHESNQRKHIEETYEKEIHDTRKLLDDMAQDKANMELDLARLDHDLKDQKNEASKNLNNFTKTKQDLEDNKEMCAAKDRKISEQNRNLSDLQNVVTALQAENKKAVEERKLAFSERDLHEADARKLRMDNKDFKEKISSLEKRAALLKKEVDETRSACQDEALKRVNCENQIATLSETLEFERRVNKDRLNDAKGNESFAANVESAVASRLSQALEDMRAEHEAELESTVNKLKYQYSNKLKNQEEKIANMQEKERELSSNLKNSEITRYNLEKAKKLEVTNLKKLVETLETDVETFKTDVEYQKAEKDRISVDLQSRKAVWEENEENYQSQIKSLNLTLEAKNLSEQQLKSELNKFGVLMSAAEEKHKVPSPDRNHMRQVRKAKQNKARNKRRLSQMKLGEQNSKADGQGSSKNNSMSFTPQAKRPYSGSTLILDSDSQSSPNKRPTGVGEEENKECRIM